MRSQASGEISSGICKLVWKKEKNNDCTKIYHFRKFDHTKIIHSMIRELPVDKMALMLELTYMYMFVCERDVWY